jgi:hypothetical protein
MTRHLTLDESALAGSFGQRPCPVRHQLQDHRLLTLDALGELADWLPEAQVEHNVGALPDVVPGGEAPRLEQKPGEIARGIEQNGCWMVLKNVERSPEYRALLDECLDQVAEAIDGREGGMLRREAYIFLSAPGSTTPAHTDPEHNLLLQVRGRKDMTIGRFPDAATEQQELESYYDGGHRNVEWLPADGHTYELNPGDGIYVPVHAPHLVKNGDRVSISFSITFRTPAADSRMLVHSFNRRLRRLGMSPKPPGARRRVDSAKAVSMRAMDRLLPGR